MNPAKPEKTWNRTRLDPRYLAPSSAYAYWQTLAPVALFAATIVLASRVTSVWFGIVLALVIGVLIYRIYFPLHESSHYNFFRTRFENRLFGHLTAAILFTRFSEFRRQHVVHHRMFGTLEDPGAVDYYVRFRTRGELVRFLLSPLVGGSLWLKVSDYWQGVIGGKGDERRAEAKRKVDPGGITLGCSALALVQGGLLLILSQGLNYAELWRYPAFALLPGATIFLFLSRLRMFLEHTSLDYDELDFLSNPRPFVRTIYANWIERLLLCGANFNYHYEHHLYPAAPACRLPRLHEEMIREGMEPEELCPTYTAAFRELWDNLGREATPVAA